MRPFWRLVDSHIAPIHVGDVSKHMNHHPEFDTMDATHVALSALVEKAHNE